MLCMNPEEQAQRILALEQENQALRARIAELERRLGKSVKQVRNPHQVMD